MANEPITREEILLNAVATGEQANIKPITREEMFLAKLGGADVTAPTPITRKEQFLQKAIENGGNTGSGGNTGGNEGWIGDGNTHIWITLHEGRTSPMLGVCPNGTVTVDWGDGTTPDVLTGTNLTTVKYTPNHEYAKAGDYVITLTVNGEMGFYGQSEDDHFLRKSQYGGKDSRVYANAVQKAEIGNGVTSIGNYAFAHCCSLESINMSESVTAIGKYAFNYCYSLVSITIPAGVTSIGTSVFYYCYGARYYDFTKHTSVPTLGNKDAFDGIQSDCEIRVPAALYDEWIAATNWTTYASQIVAV